MDLKLLRKAQYIDVLIKIAERVCDREVFDDDRVDFAAERHKDGLFADDLDLAFGKMKLGFQSSAAGHNGVASIIDRLGTNAFYRLRFGIGRPALKGQEVDYVLSPFEEEEDPLNHLIEKAGRVVINLMEEGFEKAQQMCHNRDTA